MELTLLDKSDIESDWKLARPTDLAILSNVYVDSESGYGEFWTRTIINNEYYYCRYFSLLEDYKIQTTRDTNNVYAGIRPVLEFDKASFKPFLGKQEVTYGEYPQKVLSREKQQEIEEVFKILPITGKFYMLRVNDEDGLLQDTHTAYFERIYKNKKYIKVRTSPCFNCKHLSHDRTWLDLDYIIEVEPITWIVDEEKERLVSKYVLLGGVPMHHIAEESKFVFQNTSMYTYLYGVLSKEIIPSTYSSHLLDEDQSLYDYFLKERKQQLIKRKKW